MMSPTSSPNASTLPPPPAGQPDDFDLLADVSHHGSTLFEFLSLPSPSFDAPSFPAAHAHAPGLPASALSDTTTVVGYNPSRSVSTTSPRGASVAEQTLHAVESECTADPSDTLSGAQKGKVETGRNVGLGKSGTQPTIQRHASLPERVSTAKQETGVTMAASGASRLVRRTSLPPTRTIAKPRTQPVVTHGRNAGAKKKMRGQQGGGMMNGSEGSEQSKEVNGSMEGKQGGGLVNGKVSGGVDATSTVEEGQSKDTHNSHTRRCRAKVNSKFQELLSILPAPPPKTGIKHKAQILDYTIRVFRDIHARKTLLEAELALSSRSQLNNWIANVLSRSVSLQDALAPYLSLICTKGGWKYSEAWVPSQEPGRPTSNDTRVNGISGESQVLTPSTIASSQTAKLRLGLAVIPSLGNTDDPDLQSKLERFRDRSRAYVCKPRVDLPGRVVCTMRPEWLPTLEDQEAFQRARLARAATLVVCFGVPIFIRGYVAAVAVFFDTEQRPYDAKCVDLADNIAGLLGNAFGASNLMRKKAS